MSRKLIRLCPFCESHHWCGRRCKWGEESGLTTRVDRRTVKLHPQIRDKQGNPVSRSVNKRVNSRVNKTVNKPDPVNKTVNKVNKTVNTPVNKAPDVNKTETPAEKRKAYMKEYMRKKREAANEDTMS